MEQLKKKIVELTHTTVIIETIKVILVNGVEYRSTEPIQASYVNNPRERTLLQQQEPSEIQNAVLAMWGDSATLPDPYGSSAQ